MKTKDKMIEFGVAALWITAIAVGVILLILPDIVSFLAKLRFLLKGVE